MTYLKKYFFTSFFIAAYFILVSFTFKDQFKNAKKGDFIVTHENKNYSILIVKDIFLDEKNNKVTLAEITVPKDLVNIKNFSWQSYIDKDAPQNISFNIYEIDLEKNRLIKGYSFTNKCYFTDPGQIDFFTKLLNLPLKKTPDDQRKKIGPPPIDDSLDTRAIWNPPQIINGKKMKNPQFNVYQTSWPKDGTELSGKIIDIYFDKNKFISFPYWIQVSNGNIDIMLKIIDSGKNLNCHQNILK